MKKISVITAIFLTMALICTVFVGCLNTDKKAEESKTYVGIDINPSVNLVIGENGKPFCHYLIGSSDAKPLREFVLEMKAALAPDKEFVFGDVPFTGVNMPLSDFDCSITEKDTGFRATIPFGEGVKKTMDWIKEQK